MNIYILKSSIAVLSRYITKEIIIDINRDLIKVNKNLIEVNKVGLNDVGLTIILRFQRQRYINSYYLLIDENIN